MSRARPHVTALEANRYEGIVVRVLVLCVHRQYGRIRRRTRDIARFRFAVSELPRPSYQIRERVCGNDRMQ